MIANIITRLQKLLSLEFANGGKSEERALLYYDNKEAGATQIYLFPKHIFLDIQPNQHLLLIEFKVHTVSCTSLSPYCMD